MFLRLRSGVALINCRSLLILPYYLSYAVSINTVGVTTAAVMLYTVPAWVALVEKARGSLVPLC